MKHNVLCLLVISILIGVLLVGCNGKSGDAGMSDDSTDAIKDSPQTSGQVVSGQSAHADNMLTSIEAVDLAYSEAQKWRSDAVLWDLQPVPASLDSAWASNDLAGEWIVMFANKSDERCFTVNIGDSKVQRAAEESFTVRKIAVPKSISDGKLKVSMKDAARAAIESGMPANPMNLLTAYLIENYTPEWNGKPVWQFMFPMSNACYCYAVDGLSGKLLAIQDENGNEVDPAGVKKEQKRPKEDARKAVVEFFELIDKGKTDQALDMMVPDMVADEQNHDMWLAALNDVESIEMDKITEFTPDSWTDAMEYYKCSLTVRLKDDAQFGLWEDGEIIRFITVQAVNGEWKVLEISANP